MCRKSGRRSKLWLISKSENTKLQHFYATSTLSTEFKIGWKSMVSLIVHILHTRVTIVPIVDVCLYLVRLTDDLYFMESFLVHLFHVAIECFLLQNDIIMEFDSTDCWPSNIQMIIARKLLYLYFFLYMMMFTIFSGLYRLLSLWWHTGQIRNVWGNLKDLKLMTQTAATEC